MAHNAQVESIFRGAPATPLQSTADTGQRCFLISQIVPGDS